MRVSLLSCCLIGSMFNTKFVCILQPEEQTWEINKNLCWVQAFAAYSGAIHTCVCNVTSCIFVFPNLSLLWLMLENDAEERAPMPTTIARLKGTRHCEHTPNHEEVRVWSHASLISTTHGSGRSVSSFNRFIPRKKKHLLPIGYESRSSEPVWTEPKDFKNDLL